MRKENIDFLASSYLSSVKNKVQKIALDNCKALLDWYFGCGERTVAVCARKAYRDLQRNLGGVGKMTEEDKGKYRQQVEKLIADSVDVLISNNSNFDLWHDELCIRICKMSENLPLKDSAGFSYGLAQKWLNMTIKNMLVMEQWDSAINQFKEYVHVPVDNYIMQAASELLNIKIPDRTGALSIYSERGSKPWSKWKEKDYKDFQQTLRAETAKQNSMIPIEWEFSAWLHIKKKRDKLANK